MTSKEIKGTVYGLARNMQAQKDVRSLYSQVSCEKHDYVMVTQTTTTQIGSKVEIRGKKNWLQCKNCGKILPSDYQELKK